MAGSFLREHPNTVQPTIGLLLTNTRMADHPGAILVPPSPFRRDGGKLPRKRPDPSILNGETDRKHVSCPTIRLRTTRTNRQTAFSQAACSSGRVSSNTSTHTRMATRSQAILVATRIIHPASSIHSPEKARSIDPQWRDGSEPLYATLEDEHKERWEDCKRMGFRQHPFSSPRSGEEQEFIQRRSNPLILSGEMVRSPRVSML